MTFVRCPSPTCHDKLQDFQDLKGDPEIAAAELVLLPKLKKGDHFVAKAFHRCHNGSCRRVQKKNDWQVGTYLPEGF
ncbi:hypothetical protein M2271_001218 [Streptomyces sp. LBL]|uniref:hypothetical protein n=1 Tax=Streptomyces sp. LBL TaxID=2940562 RepID=UPI002474A638|nr:hypothetical protein [Streptomyces sp. LBL]MDH6623431.1 hypothetical protein [Streptomyces sp. LBL]